MQVPRWLAGVREWMGQLPSYAFHFFFSWLYTTAVLRFKAACCPYPRVRQLLLRRSGVRLGKQVETNFGTVIVGISRDPPAVVFEDRCSIGPQVCFIASCYPGDSRLLDHPEARRMFCRVGPIRVGEDAWIGAHAIIFPGVTIGRGSVVGAGSVVRDDVPPYTVVAGVPARVIRRLTALGENGREDG